MDAEQRGQLIDAFEVASFAAGHELYSGAARLKAWLDEQYPFLEATQSRERLDAFFASCTDADREHITQFIALLAAMPALLQQFVTDAVVKTAAELPNAPPGRRSIQPEVKRKVVDAVGRLHMQGVAMGIAQARAGRQFGLATRTVQRIWQRRQQLAEQPFQSMDDVWKFLGVN